MTVGRRGCTVYSTYERTQFTAHSLFLHTCWMHLSTGEVRACPCENQDILPPSPPCIRHHSCDVYSGMSPIMCVSLRWRVLGHALWEVTHSQCTNDLLRDTCWVSGGGSDAAVTIRCGEYKCLHCYSFYQVCLVCSPHTVSTVRVV